jgi:HEAT repeat protein
LQSGDIAVRAEAAGVLGRIGDARAVEPLIAVLKQDNRTVRYCACQALGKLGDARAVEPLIAALKDDDLWMRHVACEALGKLGDARAVEPLIAGLKHEDFEHCAWPFDALQKLSDSRAVEPLAAALEDPDWNVREDAAKALTELGVPNDAETRAWFAVSVRDWRAAVALGSDALEPLAAALKHPDGNVREGATWALGDIGDARAVKPLMAALENGGPGSLQIRSVVAALEKLYRSGTLAASDQQLILNQRDRMARRHYDFGTLGGCGSSPSHSDSEFGLEF